MLNFISILFSIVLTPTGIGFAMDTAFSGAQSRRKLLRIIRHSGNISRIKSINEVFDVAFRTIFSRLFGERFWSFRFFVTSSILSVLSISIIISLQYITYRQFFDTISISYSNVLLWALLISGNCLIDYISFGQTYFIFQSLRSNREISAVVIMIFGDFIITMNIFILLAPIIILIYYIIDVPEIKRIHFHGTVVASPLDQERRSQFSNKGFQSSDLMSIVVDIAQDDSEDYVTALFEANTDQKLDIERMILPHRSIEITYSNFSLQKDLANADDPKSDELSGTYTFNGQLEFRTGNIFWSYFMIYSAAFEEFDTLELLFPDSINLNPINLSLDDINSRLNRGRIIRATYDFYCLSQPDLAPEDATKCKRFAAPSYSSYNTILSFFLDRSYSVRKFEFPMNSFLLSSFCSTFFLYTSLIGILVLKILSGSIRRFSRKGMWLLYRYPYTVSGLALGVAAYVLSGVVDIAFTAMH